MKFGIRPECLRLAPQGRPNARRGVIENTTFFGPHRHLAIRLESGEVVTAQIGVAAGFTCGEAVQVSWDPADELRFPS